MGGSIPELFRKLGDLRIYQTNWKSRRPRGDSIHRKTSRRSNASGIKIATGLNCQRQWNQAQTSAANGISARAYLNLNVHLAVLCRNTIMPRNPPGQPPSAPNITRIDSETRQPERCALRLSNPNTRNVAALNAANQMAANESGIFKQDLF